MTLDDEVEVEARRRGVAPQRVVDDALRLWLDLDPDAHRVLTYWSEHRKSTRAWIATQAIMAYGAGLASSKERV